MSKQELVVLGRDGADGCCPGLLTAPLDEARSIELAKVFKALDDPIRLRLLSMIASRAGGEVCVCDLTPAFDLSQPTISHHLKLLGLALLDALIASTEAAGIWTIQSGIFPENTASLALHRRAGFRTIGTRERIGRHHGIWRDVVLIERRSPKVG
ncbi:helix-turn-helix domain-containing GNAT family N-acetyltransferase [Streptomyces malaysiensis]|uniref:Metalloregulator ArsR/SmtB family transcription factor n=1 Tax=Streptomyces malaysiensis subsp. samsunensis TaxID=459658 RepID=A0A9X2LWK9_STRMQ|nr:metalloregulator ArsR/SmtB family transcription factor [Streptomyces samsunensis]MCQ8830811.1 metalloregulator ArsR/SmtB family transcription factor [Streptomyces samsunensis]